MRTPVRVSDIRNRLRRGVMLGMAVVLCTIVLVPATAAAAYRQTYGFVNMWAFTTPPLGFAPAGMSMAPNGDLLVANNGDYVAQYTKTGDEVAKLGQAAGISQIIDVASVGDDMWVVSNDNEVKKLTTAGLPAGITLSGSPQPFNMTSAVAVDAAGFVYVADKGGLSGYTVQITKFTSAGTYVTTFGTHGSDNTNWLWSASSISIGPKWEVYVADWQGGAVRKYVPTDATRTSYTPAATWKSSDFQEPISVDVDAGGNVFVLDSTTSTITKLNSSGGALAHWGGTGTSPGKFTTPRGILVAADGRVFVSDRDALNVQQFKLLDLGPKTSAAAAVTVKKGKKAKFKYKVDEDIGSTASVTLRVYKGSKLKATIRCGTVPQGVWRTKYWKCRLPKGKYTWRVYATDGAGNRQRNIATKRLTVK